MKQNIDNLQRETAFFQRHTVAFKKNKQQEWQELEDKLATSNNTKRRTVLYYTIGIAATVLLALTFASKFYTKTYESLDGGQKVCTLPDGSKVQLNVASKLTYCPLEWYFSRKVKLSGEAFFKVEKGSRFTVYSQNGSTAVLGTSFNVYARDDAYKVACITGKVGVKTQGNAFEIMPGEAIVWNAASKTLTKTEQQQENLIAWRTKRLLFKASPLREVFNSLERHYDVYIAYYPNEESYKYSGNISLENSIEDNLSIVCKPFQKKWEEKAQREKKKLYIIN